MRRSISNCDQAVFAPWTTPRAVQVILEFMCPEPDLAVTVLVGTATTRRAFLMLANLA